MRKTTAMTSLISFLLVILTSVILYITPHGRVANWADWRLWGLTKTQWTNIHINLGILFLIAILLHLYYNWKPITSYMKNKARSFRLFTPSFNAGLIASAVVTVGTLLYVPPFSTVIEFSESIKDEASTVWGEPPYGHAELSSLSGFASKMNYDVRDMLARLDEAGVEYGDASWTLVEVAEANGLSPQGVYLIMRPEDTGEAMALPDASPEGLGNLTVDEFSNKYGLNAAQVLAAFQAQGIEATAETKFRDAAEAGGTSASELYMRILPQLRGAGSVTQDEAQATGAGGDEPTPTGLGRMTLANMCAAHGIDLDAALATLQAQGIEAAPEDKVRDIADRAATTPENLYLLLK